MSQFEEDILAVETHTVNTSDGKYQLSTEKQTKLQPQSKFLAEKKTRDFTFSDFSH